MFGFGKKTQALSIPVAAVEPPASVETPAPAPDRARATPVPWFSCPAEDFGDYSDFRKGAASSGV